MKKKLKTYAWKNSVSNCTWIAAPVTVYKMYNITTGSEYLVTEKDLKLQLNKPSNELLDEKTVEVLYGLDYKELDED